LKENVSTQDAVINERIDSARRRSNDAVNAEAIIRGYLPKGSQVHEQLKSEEEVTAFVEANSHRLAFIKMF
jgi:hypothetical protein